MIDKTTDLAQNVAESLSRRTLMARAGRVAGLLAVAIGGVLLVPGEARAGKFCFSDADCSPSQICSWAYRCRPRKNKFPQDQ